MEEKLTKLYNTLMLIETKGDNTKLMAHCLNYLLQLRSECAAKVVENVESVEE